MHNRQATNPTDADIQTKTQLSHSTLPQDIATLNREFVTLDNQLAKQAAEEKQVISNIHNYSVSEILQSEAEESEALNLLKTELKSRIDNFLINETARMCHQLMLEDLRTLRKLDEKIYDEIFSHRDKGITFEQAIIQTLVTHREIGKKNQSRINKTLSYYNTVLVQYLRMKVNETNRVLYATLESADIDTFNDQLDRLEKSGKVDKETASVAKQLRTVIESEKLDYARLESDIAKFRHSLSLSKVNAALGKPQNLLYCLMPDLTNPYDRFPLVTTSQVKAICTANYAQYSVLLAGVDDLAESKEADTIGLSVQGFFTAELSATRELIALQPEGKYGLNKAQWAFLLTFIEKLNRPRHWDDKSKAELDMLIVQSRDVISLLIALKKFFTNKFSLSPLQLYWFHHFNELPVNPELLLLANESDKLSLHKSSLTDLGLARARLGALNVARNEMVARLEERLDKPMLAILRVNVLHAAMLYLSGGFLNTGLLGCVLHLKRIDAMQGKLWVLTLVQNLFDPELKQFSEAISIMEKFFTRHAREYSGLAMDSFDIFLMQTLFNEGYPKGLFRMQANEIKTLNIESYSVPEICILLPDNAFKKAVERLPIRQHEKTELLHTPDKIKLSAKIATLIIPAEDKAALQEKLAAQMAVDRMYVANLKVIFESSQFIGLALSGEVVKWLREDLLNIYQRQTMRCNMRDNLQVLRNRLQESSEVKEEPVRRGFRAFSISS
jgi:hypothetical protein